MMEESCFLKIPDITHNQPGVYVCSNSRGGRNADVAILPLNETINLCPNPYTYGIGANEIDSIWFLQMYKLQ